MTAAHTAALKVIARTPHIRAYLERTDPMALRQVDAALSPMRRVNSRLSRYAQAELALHVQEVWMEKCGGTLAGYVANYGSRLDPVHSGDGGEAIYAADAAHLARLQAHAASLRP